MVLKSLNAKMMVEDQIFSTLLYNSNVIGFPIILHKAWKLWINIAFETPCKHYFRTNLIAEPKNCAQMLTKCTSNTFSVVCYHLLQNVLLSRAVASYFKGVAKVLHSMCISTQQLGGLETCPPRIYFLLWRHFWRLFWGQNAISSVISCQPSRILWTFPVFK